MTQQVMTRATKSDKLRVTPGTHMVAGKNQVSKVVL